MAIGCTLVSVTVSLWSPARLRPDSIRQPAASTSAIERDRAPPASTAICFASLAKGTPRARPDRVPSAFSVMRSFGLAGATVIAPSGEEIFACAKQPSRQHGFGERHGDGKTPGRAQNAKNLRLGLRRSRRNPPRTHDSGRPASVSACHSGAFQEPFLSLIDGLRVGEIGKDLLRGLGDNVLTLRHSVPRFDWQNSGLAVAKHRVRSFLAPHDGEKP